MSGTSRDKAVGAPVGVGFHKQTFVAAWVDIRPAALKGLTGTVGAPTTFVNATDYYLDVEIINLSSTAGDILYVMLREPGAGPAAEANTEGFEVHPGAAMSLRDILPVGSGNKPARVAVMGVAAGVSGQVIAFVGRGAP